MCIRDRNLILVKNVLRTSNHPLSRMLYDYLPEVEKLKLDEFQEITGKGIQAVVNGNQVQIGSASFVAPNLSLEEQEILQTEVHIKINDMYYGKYIFNNQY